MKDVERWLGTDKWKSDKKFILIRLPYVRRMMDDGRWKMDDGGCHTDLTDNTDKLIDCKCQ